MTVKPNDEFLSHLSAIALAVEHSRDTLRAELEQTRNAVRTSGGEPRAVVDGSGKGVRVSTSPGRLAGWSLRESAGAVAVVRLRDGADAGAELVAVVNLPAGGSSTQWLLPGGASLGNGLFADVTGSVEGVAYIGAS